MRVYAARNYRMNHSTSVSISDVVWSAGFYAARNGFATWWRRFAWRHAVASV